MNWQQQLAFVNSLARGFPLPCPLVVSKLPNVEAELRREFERLEKEHAEGVDAAVRTIARSGKRPQQLSQNETYFLRQRIEFGLLVSLALAASDTVAKKMILPNLSPEFGDEDQIEWLLIESWRVCGCQHWIDGAVLRERLRHCLRSGLTPPSGQ